jgi:protoporphyrinogen oxidase
MITPKKIVIVGGGYTGLVAALRLSADKRFSVTIIEASSDLGGLAGGFRIQGTSLEKTYHHIFLTDTAVLELVKELGLQEKLMWCESSVGIFRDGKVHPFKTPLDLLRFSPCSFFGRLRTGFAALYLKHTKNWHRFARQTAHGWMARVCGQSAMDSIWTPLLKGKFDRHYDKVSMAWFWARIHIRANSRSPGGEKLGYFRGGFNVITNALEKKLRENGVTIRTGKAVESILSDDRAVIVDGEKVSFDYCLFTGPSYAFAKLLPADESSHEYAAKLRSIEYLGAVCLVFTSDQDLGDNYWVNVNEPGAPFLVIIQHTNLIDKQLYGGKHVYYIGAYLPPNGDRFAQSDEALAKLWFDYLPKLYPQFDTKRVEEKYIFRFRAAQHIVDTEYEAKIPDYKTPLPGVFLANFSQVFPEDRGTNFAVREGEKIAALISRTVAP